MSVSSTSTTRLSFPNAVRRAGNKVSQIVLNPSFARLNADKIVSIKYPPIMLALIAGLGLIYSHGNEVSKPDGDRKLWLKGLLEAALSYGMVDNFAGIYPLWGMGVSAYRAGQKNTTLEQVQEFVKTATVMGMGYLGILSGTAFSDTGIANEEGKMHELLSDSSIEKWLNSDRITQSKDETVQRLAQSVRELREKTQFSYDNHFTIDRKLAKTLKQEMAALTSSIHVDLGQVDEGAFLPKGKDAALRFDQFRKVLGYSQQLYIQMTRRLNPIFGYLIAGLLLGIPASKAINKRIEERFPQLKQMNKPPTVEAHLAKNVNLTGGGHHTTSSDLPWVNTAMGKPEPAASGH